MPTNLPTYIYSECHFKHNFNVETWHKLCKAVLNPFLLDWIYSVTQTLVRKYKII